MEIIRVIQNWSYTIIDLFLFIYCIIRIRNHMVKYFAFGFGILFTTSLMWRLVDILGLYSTYSKIYEILGYFNLFSYIIFAGLFVREFPKHQVQRLFKRGKICQIII